MARERSAAEESPNRLGAVRARSVFAARALPASQPRVRFRGVGARSRIESDERERRRHGDGSRHKKGDGVLRARHGYARVRRERVAAFRSASRRRRRRRPRGARGRVSRGRRERRVRAPGHEDRRRVAGPDRRRERDVPCGARARHRRRRRRRKPGGRCYQTGRGRREAAARRLRAAQGALERRAAGDAIDGGRVRVGSLGARRTRRRRVR